MAATSRTPTYLDSCMPRYPRSDSDNVILPLRDEFDDEASLLTAPMMGTDESDEVDGRMNGSCSGPCGHEADGESRKQTGFTLADIARESNPKRQRVQYSSSSLPTYRDFAHLCVSLYTTEDANSSINWKHMISVSSFEDGRRHCLAFIMKQLQLLLAPLLDN